MKAAATRHAFARDFAAAMVALVLIAVVKIGIVSLIAG